MAVVVDRVARILVEPGVHTRALARPVRRTPKTRSQQRKRSARGRGYREVSQEKATAEEDDREVAGKKKGQATAIWRRCLSAKDCHNGTMGPVDRVTR